jgi:hypothetical protein
MAQPAVASALRPRLYRAVYILSATEIQPLTGWRSCGQPARTEAAGCAAQVRVGDAVAQQCAIAMTVTTVACVVRRIRILSTQLYGA